MNLGQKIIDIIRGKKTKIAKNKNITFNQFIKKREIIDKSKNIITIAGFSYSGASALIDLFSEFKNSTVFGSTLSDFVEKNNLSYQKYTVKLFIKEASIFSVIDAFENNVDEFQQDYIIKQFIKNMYKLANKKKMLYANFFIDLHIAFLENILELDNYTKDFMKGKKYPFKYDEEESIFNNCSFVKGENNGKYVLYKFKNMSKDEFNHHVKMYFKDFFNNINISGTLVMDQFFKYTNLLDRINNYLDKPIKEICVYRDPRDQFITNFIFNTIRVNNVPFDFIKHYKDSTISIINHISPNRLVIRFEDLVFDYENTLNKIYDFTGLTASEHIYKKQIFQPDISKNNVGIYKYFHNQEIIQKIEKEFPQYCFNRSDL